MALSIRPSAVVRPTAAQRGREHPPTSWWNRSPSMVAKSSRHGTTPAPAAAVNPATPASDPLTVRWWYSQWVAATRPGRVGARGASWGYRIDEIVAAHLQEAPVIGTLAADEDRLHRSFHIVVDVANAGTLEEGERAVMGVEHHLLRL